MTTSSKPDKLKQGLKIIMHRCERKYSGKVKLKEALCEDNSMKSTAFLKGTVKVGGPTLAVSNILTLFTTELTLS